MPTAVIRFVSSLLLAALLQAGSPLFRSSTGRGNLGWTVVRGSLAADPSVLDENSKLLRVDPGKSPDSCVRSATISLRLGKSYEVTWSVRTENLKVRDLDRSPIAT